MKPQIYKAEGVWWLTLPNGVELPAATWVDAMNYVDFRARGYRTRVQAAA